MKSFPKYFGLNKAPFKFSEQIYNPTLLDKIQTEDGEMNIESYKNKIDKKIEESKLKQKENNIKQNYSIDEKNNIENKRKIYIKLLKINKKSFFEKNTSKPKKIKLKPFEFHYERDIDPEEGTIPFFEKRFNRYLDKKMEELRNKLKNNKENITKFEFGKKRIIKKIKKEEYVNKLLNIVKQNYLNQHK